MDLIPPCAGRATPASPPPHRCGAAPRADDPTAAGAVTARRERLSDRTTAPHPRPDTVMTSGRPVPPGHPTRGGTGFADPLLRRPVRGLVARLSGCGLEARLSAWGPEVRLAALDNCRTPPRDRGRPTRGGTGFADPPPRRPARGPDDRLATRGPGARSSALGPRRVLPPRGPGRPGRWVAGPDARVPGGEEGA